MYFEEYGNKENPTLVMLHGIHFVHTFGKQYVLADKYHIVVPHIPGFGKATDTVFTAKQAIDDIVAFIKAMEKKVILIGFSLGAQLGFQMLSEAPELFAGAVLVSPWLTKAEADIKAVAVQNIKQYKGMQNKRMCKMIAKANGLSKVQADEFAEQMQHVQLQTITNSIDNGITFESAPEFAQVSVPILALAGDRDHSMVRLSVIDMAEKNPNCQYEIWPKAAHNIPQAFAKDFNNRIIQFVDNL